jgi:hypothetical protein
MAERAGCSCMEARVGRSWPCRPTALAIDPQYPGTLYAGTIAGELATSVLSVSGGVRKSVDGGRSWSGVNTVSQSYGVSGERVDHWTGP